MNTEEIDFQIEREQAQEAITRAKKLIKKYNINYTNWSLFDSLQGDIDMFEKIIETPHLLCEMYYGVRLNSFQDHLNIIEENKFVFIKLKSTKYKLKKELEMYD